MTRDSEQPASSLGPSQDNAPPHPNQIRYACDCCRRQKLRCLPPAGDGTSCARCARLGKECRFGGQGRPGRPPRKSLMLRKAANPTPTSTQGSLSDDWLIPSGTNLLESLLSGSENALDWPLNWPLDGNMLPSLSPSISSFPIDPKFQAGQLDLDIDVSVCEPPDITPSSTLFQNLSRLNVDIKTGWDGTSRLSPLPSFKDFVCGDNDGIVQGYESLQSLLQCAQEFLVVIKALHRQLGARPVSRPSLYATRNAPISTPSELPSSQEDIPQTAPSYDAPTIFLVVSCYIQLVKHFELIFRIIQDSISDAAQELIGPAPMAYADVPLNEASTQFILFSEIVRHVIGQINLVLGLPSSWTGKSAWTGLLRRPRHRDMVNQELGAIDGEWTTRPARVLEMATRTKDMFTELAMLGFDI